MIIIKSLLLLVIGFVLLVKGADWFVEGSAAIARKLNIPELVIGLTIVAMGTSLPEAAVSITASLNGNAGIAVGNVAGSNIMNILIILGITSVITTIKIQKSTIRMEIPFLVLVSAVFLGFGMTGNRLSGLEGVGFWALFVVYLVYLYVMSQRNESDPAEDEKPMNRPVWQCLILLVISAIMIIKGSDLIVSGATDIAKVIGLSDRIIGLTIVAFGTSLPELVTCITAARKNKADLAIGNIVGSNIFNILFVLGTASLITPIPFESKFIVDAAFGIAAAVILWLGSFRKRELARPAGIFMICVYACYFVKVML